METGSSPTAKGFFRSLYDFHFVSLIASRFIKFLYACSVILYSIAYAVALIAVLTQRVGVGVTEFGQSTGGRSLAPLAIVLVPLYFASLIWLRIVMEFLIVIFHIAEDIHTIRLRGGSTLGQTADPVGQEIIEAADITMAAAGWYDAPDDPTRQRYWDGTSWTGHYSPQAANMTASNTFRRSPTKQHPRATRRRVGYGVGLVALIASLVAIGPAATVSAAAIDDVGFVSLQPARLLETRPGLSTVDGLFNGVGAVGPGATLDLTVVGRGGVPATGVGAVVLNITATEPTAAGYVTVFPTGPDRPTASNLNFVPGQTTANLTIAKVGAGGQVSLFNFAGSTHLIADVVGWFPTLSTFTSLQPARLLETRPGLSTVDSLFNAVGAVGPGATLDVTVVGRGGVPATGVGAVVLNITATEPTAAGFVTVFPTGTTRPTASNLNFVPGQTTPNLAIAKVGDNGQVSLFNFAGSTHLIFDVVGWFPAASSFASLQPARLLDTRPGLTTVDGLFNGVGALGGGATLDLTVAGRGGVPTTGVGAVVLNITATDPTAAGFFTVYPTGSARPTASNLNFVPGQTTPNLVVAKVGANGQVSVFNFAGNADLIADVVGWFPGTPAEPLSTAIGGDYSVVYGTAGAVTVHVSGDTYTVSVKTPFKMEGASCLLPAATVIATFVGTAPHFGGGHSVFDATTCVFLGSNAVAVDFNANGSLTLGSPTGPHLLTKTANGPSAAPVIGGDYSTIDGTAGDVTVHVSGDTYTVSVKTPYQVQGASCTLPAATVIATFSGVTPHFGGGDAVFDHTTCAFLGSNAISAFANSDQSITIGSPTGFHLLTKTANGPSAAPVIGGDYSTVYGTAGDVTVLVSGTTFTVSVKIPFKVQGASCLLPAATVIATFTGVGPHFGGGHSVFDPTTCVFLGSNAVSVFANSDQTITLGSSTGFHLLTPL
jgi:Domain of unknown function (DUF4282)/Protein of unknown function (DUF2510)